LQELALCQQQVGAKLASCLRIETTSGSFRAMSASSDTVVGGTLGESGVGVGACGMILLVSVFVFFLSFFFDDQMVALQFYQWNGGCGCGGSWD
jgi:hypothetical protein